jgi:cobalt-zinc-cadmium efflux system protein
MRRTCSPIRLRLRSRLLPCRSRNAPSTRDGHLATTALKYLRQRSMRYCSSVLRYTSCTKRFSEPPSVDSLPMLVVASVGLVVNMISMRLLASGKDGSLNVKGAYLEVWSDMLGSLGVIVGAIVIWLTGWTWIDTVIAVAIGLWVLPRTWILLRASINILLEGVPEGVDVAVVEKALLSLEGVESVHDLHVWAISCGKTSLSVHLVSAEGDLEVLTQSAAAIMAKDFEIHHVTVQVERVACAQADGDHGYD